MKLNKKYINPKTGEKYHYYSRKGEGYENVLDWAKDFEPPREGMPSRYKDLEAYKKYKIVKQETTWLGFWVSTVWLGLDHSFHPQGRPLIFETMVFFKSHSELDMDRYTTEKEALAGHKAMVKRWSNPFYVIWKYIDRKTWGLQWKWQKFVINWKNPIKRNDYLLNVINAGFFSLSVFTFVTWFLLPWYPHLRFWMSFGMGSMFVHSTLWLWKGRKSIKHEIWCGKREECGEHGNR